MTSSQRCHRYAISDAIVDCELGPVWWKVRVHLIGVTNWMLIGIVSSITAGSNSYSDVSCFGWTRQNWQQGGTVVFRLDTKHNTLSVKHVRSASHHLTFAFLRNNWCQSQF